LPAELLKLMNNLAPIRQMSVTTCEATDCRASSNEPWLPVVVQSDSTLSHGLSGDARRILDAAIAILVEGEKLLRSLSVESYTRRVSIAFNASIGGQYRHCLDHFTSILRGLDATEMCGLSRGSIWL
jgi:hypothetical protein